MGVASLTSLVVFLAVVVGSSAIRGQACGIRASSFVTALGCAGSGRTGMITWARMRGLLPAIFRIFTLRLRDWIRAARWFLSRSGQPTGTSGGLRRSRKGIGLNSSVRREHERATCSSSRPAVETGRPFHVLVRYDDGSTAETDLPGGKADDKLRVKTVALAARWIGQDRQDRTGAGPSVGGDGFQDVRIHVSRLSTKLTLNGIRVDGAGRRDMGIGAEPQAVAQRRAGARPEGSNSGRSVLSAESRSVRPTTEADGPLRQ